MTFVTSRASAKILYYYIQRFYIITKA